MRPPPPSEWPSFFPNGIPPAGARVASGQAYRIVRTIPPLPTDFRSTYEDDVDRLGHPRDSTDPSLYGTSLHLSLAGSVATRKRFPPLRGRRIATGTLVPRHGQMSEADARSHITVWFKVEAQPHRDFSVDAEATP